MRVMRVATVVAIGVVVACSEDATGSGDCTPSATVVCMLTNSYDPSTLTTARGTNVEWRNGSDLAHTTTSNPANPAACPTWDHSIGAGGGEVARVLFDVAAPVTCQYYCTLHATPTSGAMRGTVVLQ